MSPSFQPTVLASCNLTSFVEYILEFHGSPSTLLVCSTRDEFLQETLEACRDGPEEHWPHHIASTVKPPLLRPTIHLLATSRTVSIAFAPSLAHLRAYLAVYISAKAPGDSAITYDRPGNRTPLLAILNNLRLHKSSGEFSAQGISRTVATAIEAAARNDMLLLIAECSVNDQDEMIEGQIQGHELSCDPWTEQVPLLNGSIRFGSDQRAWAGRTVELRQVLGRWCQFMELSGMSYSV